MSDYKPAFQVSRQRRPWHQRLTPLAWAGIGVAAVVLILVVVLLVMQFGGGSAGAWEPTSTASPPLPEPPPTEALPSPTPTRWYEGMVTPPTGEDLPFPAWWAGEMIQDEEGRWWPPEEVLEMVQTDFLSWEEELKLRVAADDLTGTVEVLPRYHLGVSLEAAQALFAQIQNGGLSSSYFGYVEWDDLHLETRDWTSDGTVCTLGVTMQGGTTHSWDEGELRATGAAGDGLVLYRMQYDPTDGRWKQAELIAFYPAGEGDGP